jgi:hypothetical protein
VGDVHREEFRWGDERDVDQRPNLLSSHIRSGGYTTAAHAKPTKLPI